MNILFQFGVSHLFRIRVINHIAKYYLIKKIFIINYVNIDISRASKLSLLKQNVVKPFLHLIFLILRTPTL